MDRLNRLDVYYHDRPVGTMALYQKRLAAFEYNSDWLIDGFSISPFSLSLIKKVFMPGIEPFEGLNSEVFNVSIIDILKEESEEMKLQKAR